MNSECIRIADQLRRALNGDPWHGPPLSKILNGVTAEVALARPLPSVHSIWELVLHIDTDVHVTLEAMRGTAMPKLYGTELDWPAIADGGAAAWLATTETFFRNAAQLADAIEQWSDERLLNIVPGREYDFYILFHGVVQHSLYHGGQIAILKKAVAHL
jgi:hypothetical protein